MGHLKQLGAAFADLNNYCCKAWLGAHASLDADLIWRDFVKQYPGNVAEADIDHKASV